MTEWLKVHAWKACVSQKGTGGSNPPLSAKLKGRNERCGPFFWAGVRCVHRKARPQKKGARSAALELVAPPFREHAQRNPLSAKLKGRNEGCGPFFWRGEWVESALNSSWYFTCVGLRQGLTRLARKT